MILTGGDNNSLYVVVRVFFCIMSPKKVEEGFNDK
jgi:hypothetical protein